MFRLLIIITSLFFICSPLSFAQEKEPNKDEASLEAKHEPLSLPNVKEYLPLVKKYTSACKKCQPLVYTYNQAMIELTSVTQARSYLLTLRKKMDKLAKLNQKRKLQPKDNAKPLNSIGNFFAAYDLDTIMSVEEMLAEDLPALNEVKRNLEQTMRGLAKQIEACEKQCEMLKDKQKSKTGGKGGITTGEMDAKLPFAWKGPYAPVCYKCGKLAIRLNELPSLYYQNATESDSLKARKVYLHYSLRLDKFDGEVDKETIQARLRHDKKELKKIKKTLKRLDKNRKKITKNFNETLKLYNKCIKKCPVKKTACLFPGDQTGKNQSIMIGANNKYGSSAQQAKELRDKATGVAKNVATKAVGKLLGGFGGFGKFGGGGGSKGPKTDRDPTKGKFTNISYGDTNLDIRASWKNNQLIVSSKINNAPGSGTFHAQWIEAQDGTIYLPVRYLTIKLYRDWKLTVSWTEDHFIDGKNVFHDEGRNITMGRDLLGTWDLFQGAEGVANSIWSMLGFETAVKGVKQLGAVYDIPPSAFSDPCQMQLVTHISLPKGDPVTTVPLVADLFKHVDESKRKPKLLILVQPHIL